MDPHHDTWILWIKSNKKPLEIFEVVIGTILVQNTNWINVNRAIANVLPQVSSFEDLLAISNNQLIEWIKPAGFFYQKANYLQNLAQLLFSCEQENRIPTRKELLQTKGIGKETADSILNFCFEQPIPVIGTYTRRFLARLTGDATFLKMTSEKIQQHILETFLGADSYQLGHFHALIVVHNQNICHKKNPGCFKCIFEKQCWFGKQNEDSPAKLALQRLISPPRKRSKPKS